MSIPLTPLGQAGHQSIEIENDGSGNPLYVGYARPGSLTSDANWLIMKITYTGGFITRVRWSSPFGYSQVWDNRATTVVYA